MALLRRLVRLRHKEYFWITVLTLVVLAMHLAIIFTPPTLVLDEQYYVPDARHVLDGSYTLRAEHPPLGELMVVAGIVVFGDNPFGWRIVAVLMGSAIVLLLYLICRRLGVSRGVSLLAAALLGLENLTFIQTSIAMLDVYSLFFMFLAFWLYLRGGYPAASVAGVAATLCKLSGGLTFVVIGLHWLLTRRDRGTYFAASMLLAPFLFFIMLPPLDFILTKHFVDPFMRVSKIIGTSASITFINSSHPSASRPWQWLLQLKVMPYNYNPDYLAVVSPPLWALIIPTFGYLCYLVRKASPAAIFALCWFTGTYLIWIPLSLLTNRLSYIYYFLPVVGSICIGLALGLGKLLSIWQDRERRKRTRRLALAGFVSYLVIYAVAFVGMTPVFLRNLPTLGRLFL